MKVETSGYDSSVRNNGPDPLLRNQSITFTWLDVRSVEVEVQGEVNDRNMTPVLRLLSSISQMVRLCGEAVMEVLKEVKSIAKVIGRFPRVFRGGITKPFDKVLMTASTDA